MTIETVPIAPVPIATEIGPAPTSRRSVWSTLAAGDAVPIATVVIVLLVLWYLGCILMNASLVRTLTPDAERLGLTALVTGTMALERPQLPAPHQIVAELRRTVLEVPITSRRSLVHHAWVTLSSSLVGFAFGTALGLLLAVCIVHVPSLQMSLLPWIISSQTIPILAVAPIVIVVLGAVGLTGLVPKAIISAYLCFFPVTIGMVKGLRSPEPLQLDLVHTYSAGAWTVFWKLRWPASLPFLFTSLKVAIAISLVGAIVGELPTGAQAGLGARLLAGSYYGQTIQIWAALFAAAILAAALVAVVGLIERVTGRLMGFRS